MRPTASPKGEILQAPEFLHSASLNAKRRLAVFLLAFIPGLVTAQGFPTKPVRLITAEAGGGADFAARLIAAGASPSLGQQMVVVNMGSGIIQASTVAKAPPDGYTLLLNSGTVWIAQLTQDVPYDVLRDFAPVTLAARSPSILVVNPNVPVKSVAELIAFAKAKPGQLHYSSGAEGSRGFLATELFKAMAGVDIVYVPYKGNGPALTAAVAGEVQMIIVTPGEATVHVKSGRLRALAVTGPKPSALIPDLPTVSGSGLPGYESESITGIFSPARTPAAIIAKLNQDIVAGLNKDDIKQKFLAGGVETVGTSPEEFWSTLKNEMTQLAKVIQGMKKKN